MTEIDMKIMQLEADIATHEQFIEDTKEEIRKCRTNVKKLQKMKEQFNEIML